MIARRVPYKAGVALLFLLSCALGSSQSTDQKPSPSQPGAATTAASGPTGPTVCDPVTFLNCHREKGVKPPKLTHSEDSECPWEARSLRPFNATTVVELIVDETGKLHNISVVHSSSENFPPNQQEIGSRVDKSVINAVKAFRFKSATRGNEPVPVQITITFHTHCL
jgi:TonB family protein